MPAFCRFMHTAHAVLDQQDRDRLSPNPHQPPVLLRTNWLFTEIDEALTECARLSTYIKVARLNGDVTAVSRLNDELADKLEQTSQLTGWVEEQFQREVI